VLERSSDKRKVCGTATVGALQLACQVEFLATLNAVQVSSRSDIPSRQTYFAAKRLWYTVMIWRETAFFGLVRLSSDSDTAFLQDTSSLAQLCACTGERMINWKQVPRQYGRRESAQARQTRSL